MLATYQFTFRKEQSTTDVATYRLFAGKNIRLGARCSIVVTVHTNIYCTVSNWDTLCSNC